MSREHPTVMVVDDQELFRVGIKQLLGERGIRVIGDAGRGAQAVRQACELHPDVVLMDLNMPGMSGVEATQRLTTAAPLVKVLVLTVAADERHVMDALLAGACANPPRPTLISQALSSRAGSTRSWSCSRAGCPIRRSPGPYT